jgi:hypothetical protein
MMRTRYLLAALLSVVLAACTTGATASPTAAPSTQPPEAPAASPSAQPPEAPAPIATTSVLDVKVTFDGETCTYLGPSVILDGTMLRMEYAPEEEVSNSYLWIFGVKSGTTYEDLVEVLANDDGNVTTDAPDWVYQPTLGWTQAASTLLYKIESVKQGKDLVDYAVGGYQVMCVTPAGYPAAQLSVAGP